MVKEKEKNKEKGETRLLIYDVIFKAVFERVPDILIKMIRDILNIEESTDPFVFSGFESNSGVFNGKTYKGDVTIRLSDKSVVIIEMNYRKDKSVIDRNMIHLTRVLSQILKSGTPDNDLKDYRIRGLNLNNFPNDTGEVIERFAICNIKTNKIASNVYSFCNLSLEKCVKLLYDKDVKNLPKEVRWGAILLEENIDKISAIIYCEHKSQKGILIGKGGNLLKKIGTESRLELEKIVEKKVFLELQVKVEKDWRKKDKILKTFGYQQEKE